MNKQAIIEAAKEVLRLAYLAALTAVIGYISQKVGALDPTSTFYVIGTVVLRFLDKYVHVNPNIKANGISII